jgi:cytochrome b6-f complex iron-sulfur subunit
VGTSLAMFQDFFGPKVLKEPKKQWRVGKLDAFSMPNTVDESFKRTPDGGTGFWMVNLQPAENKLVAINTICTHLGCIPNWLAGENKFKCPCHGSGYYMNGVNFEGPTPRPLERFAINVDADGFVNVDQSKVYRSELGEWDNPESFVML